MAYVTVDVDIDLDEFDDDELIDELNSRGYTVSKEPVPESFDREDWHFLLDMLDKQQATWYNRRVRDKLMEACFG